MTLDACLPEELRGKGATFTPMAAGWSGAKVYRVDAVGRTLVLKLAEREPLADWRRKIELQRGAAEVGVAPAVLHVDEERRAVVTAFVADRSFPARYGDPRTRAAAVEQLGRMLARVHELPVPDGADVKDPRDLLVMLADGLASGFAVPAFARDAIDRVRAEEPPPRDRPRALCHNDVNPTNLVDDGERLLLLDWDTAGPGDALYDLAAIAVFLRMDDETCARLVAAHDGAAPAALPAGFVHARRLVAALCGAMFLHLARMSGHRGATDETLAGTASLADFYQRLRAGDVDVATAEGKWAFGLALLKASTAL